MSDKVVDLFDKSHVILYVFLLYAIGGLIVVLAQPDTMDFGAYSTRLIAFGAALGIARGYASGKRAEGEGRAGNNPIAGRRSSGSGGKTF
jgi:uncharacterized membrane protein